MIREPQVQQVKQDRISSDKLG